MNPITQALHKLIINTGTEEFFVTLRRGSSTLRKFIPVRLRNKFTSVGRFIPHASEYPKDDCYYLTRDHVNFKINRSDYVHWRLFYGARDNALNAAKKYVTPGSIVLDIGANFGAFSLRLAAALNKKGYENVRIDTFEPNPSVYENYVSNLELNPHLASMINAHPIGLGNEAGEFPFEFEKSNTGAGRVVGLKQDGRYRVNIHRLDDFIAGINPLKISFIKLIAGGFEPQVMEGGWETITKHKPPIFIEVTRKWWHQHNFTVEDVLGKLNSMGYQFMIEDHNEMLPYNPLKHSSRSQFNLLATR